MADLCAIVLMVGLYAAAYSVHFRVHTYEVAATDFKTLYAAARCFAEGVDAYRLSNIAAVFAANHIVAPETWYGHSPVYPPFTLLILAPFTVFSLEACAWAAYFLGAVLFALALIRIAAYSRLHLGLGPVTRLVILAGAVALPLFAFALFVGNVSVIVSALCLLVVLAEAPGRWWRAFALTVAMLLKPHIAVWLMPALLFSPLGEDRRTGRRASGLFVLIVCGMLLSAALNAHLLAQLHSYQAVLADEFGAGSMSNGALFKQVPAAQVVGLATLLGYFWPAGAAAAWVSRAVPVLLAATLVFTGLRLRRSADDPNWNHAQPLHLRRLILTNGWLAIGLIATYHRAHDALVLYSLLPCIAWYLRRRPLLPQGWLLLAALLLLSIQARINAASASLDSALGKTVAASSWAGALNNFLTYRQAAAAALLLALLLTALSVQATRPPRARLAM